MNDAKHRSDEDQMALEEMQMAKKRTEKEAEALQERLDELQNENSKLNKSRKKLQEEVGMALELHLFLSLTIVSFFVVG